MENCNGYGACLCFASLTGAAVIVGDDAPNWQIIFMLGGGFVMTIVALTFDRFDFTGEDNTGFVRQMRLYIEHLLTGTTRGLEVFRPSDRVAVVKIPVVFFLPLGLVTLAAGCAYESSGLAPNGWNLNDYFYWIRVTLAGITFCLIYALITSPLRRK